MITVYRSVLCSIMVFSGATAWGQGDGNLGILPYLGQVREKHDTYRASKDQWEASTLRADEARLLVEPNFFGSAQHLDDHKPGTLFNYDSAVTNSYQLGVSENTAFGLSGQLYYSVTDQTYNNLSVGGPAQSPHTIQASPILQLTLPLWRNWLGAETSQLVNQGEAQTAANRANDNFQMRNILVQAALAYWNLDLVRETVRVTQDSVKRNDQLFRWHRQRAQDGLSDRSDVLQADAALKTAQINLKNANDQEVAAGRTFNLARGVDAFQVPERLMPMTEDLIQNLKPPIRKPLRDDVLAALHQVEVTKAAAELSRQKYLPTLEVYGQTGTNNANPTDTTGAYQNSFNYSLPTNLIGIRFNAPLDFGLVSDTRKGWEKEKLASDQNYRRKLLEQDFDWHNLEDKFQEAQDRFHLYTDLEKKQKEKFDYERSRRTTGRTTTQQVLLFENDFESAQYSRIQALSDFFNIYSQMKLYEEVSNESR